MNTIAASDSTGMANRGRAWKWIALGIGALVLVVLLAYGFMLYRMNDVPAIRSASGFPTTPARAGAASGTQRYPAHTPRSRPRSGS
jgi:hypothetical protein